MAASVENDAVEEVKSRSTVVVLKIQKMIFADRHLKFALTTGLTAEQK